MFCRWMKWAWLTVAVVCSIIVLGNAHSGETQDLSMVVVVANNAQLPSLQMSQCTWMREHLSSDNLIVVSRIKYLEPHQGQCTDPLSPSKRLFAPYTSDYLDIAARLHGADIEFKSWIMLVQAHTLVHIPHLASLIKGLSGTDHHYIGAIRSSADEPAYLGTPPHVTPENGILMSRFGWDHLVNRIKKVPGDPLPAPLEGLCTHPDDLRGLETLSSAYAACLFMDGILPYDASEQFIFFSDEVALTDSQRSSFITLSPVSATQMIQSSASLGVTTAPIRDETALVRSAWEHMTKGKIVYGVLTRETDITGVVEQVLSTWGKDENVFFFARKEHVEESYQDVRTLVETIERRERQGSRRLDESDSRDLRHRSSSRLHTRKSFRMPPTTSEAPTTLSSRIPNLGLSAMFSNTMGRLHGQPYSEATMYENLSSKKRQVRMIGVDLDPLPSEDTNFGRFEGQNQKPPAWEPWLRNKVKHITMFLHDTRIETIVGGAEWFMLVDDDTYVVPHKLKKVVSAYRSSTPVAIGREFSHPAMGSILGGGPGVIVSLGALKAMRDAKCPERNFPLLSRSIRGGDYWWSRCFRMANVTIQHDWRFKSMQPMAYSPEVVRHAVSFHKAIPTQAQKYLQDLEAQDYKPATDKLCSPMLLKGISNPMCAPHFSIIGAQKSGTTSMFEYLRTHPQVQLPQEKEINFFGSPWPLSKKSSMQTYTRFYSRYIMRLPLSNSSKSVTGEASPDYFVAGPQVVYNMMKYVPRIRLIVSLRAPIDRAVSAYENKKADKKLHQHLDEKLWRTRRVDRRTDDEVEGYSPPSFPRLVRAVQLSLEQCPDHTLHFTMNEPATQPSCYINPFVMHGNYAKYLAPYLKYFNPSTLHVVDFHEFEHSPSVVMDRLGDFLGIRNFHFHVDNIIFNSRDNRGVHAPTSNVKVGGVVHAMSVDKVDISDWSEHLPPASREILERYYHKPNKELRALLAHHGYPPVSWAVE